MPGRTRAMPDVPPRLAIFAGASLLLHILFVIGVQLAGKGEPPRAPGAAPVQMIDLPPPLPPTPVEPTESAPGIPQATAPVPPAPDRPAQADEAPPPAAPPRESATAIVPEDTPPDSLAIPGLVYDDGVADLARFGQALDCASLNNRYEDSCLEIGPIRLAGDEVQPLAPEIVQAWRERDAEQAAVTAMRNSADKQAVVPCGLSVCVPPPERFQARGQGVRAGLREMGVIE